MLRTLFFITGLYLIHGSAHSNPKLPDLGSPDLTVYDAQMEQQWGQAFSAALHEQYQVIEDPESISLLLSITQKITQQVNPPRPFTFYLIDQPEINAFAGPNGIIGLNTGLILTSKNEDELASVIAHEVAHVTQHHLSRTLKQQPQVNLTSIATLLAAILVGSQNPSAGIATYMSGMGLNLQQQLKNSRQHEKEADDIGMQYLTEAGYDPHAMADFFAKLQRLSQLNTFQPPEILLTHPITENRLAEAENRADQLAPPKNRHNSERLNLLKIRLLQQTPHNKMPATLQSTLNEYEKCYQKNLIAYEQVGDYYSKDTVNCLLKIEHAQPNVPFYALLSAQIWLKQANEHNLPALRTKALKKLAFLHDLYPQDMAINIRYAQALNQDHQTQKAQKLLEASTKTNPQPYLLYKTLADLMAQHHKNAYAYYYKALAQQSIGNLKRFHILLNRAEQHLIPTNLDLKKKIDEAKRKNKNKIKDKDKPTSNTTADTLMRS